MTNKRFEKLAHVFGPFSVTGKVSKVARSYPHLVEFTQLFMSHIKTSGGCQSNVTYHPWRVGPLELVVEPETLLDLKHVQMGDERRNEVLKCKNLPPGYLGRYGRH